MRIVFAGGGTGGHIFPGLAVAASLETLGRDVQCEFWGDGRALETALLSKHGAKQRVLPCAPLPRRPLAVPRFLYCAAAGYLAARRLLKDLDVRGVVALGGYSSWAPATAARHLGLPMVILEQNAVAGRANVHLARKAALVCLSWPQASKSLPLQAEAQVTGNPVRREIVQAAKTSIYRSTGGILVLGGSSGAAGLNDLVMKAAGRLTALGRQIIHQTGEKDLSRVAQFYESLGREAVVTAFIDDMPAAYSAASLVIARAGGTTLSEIALFGIPAILVPYPHHRDRHQYENASIFAQTGAAVIIQEAETGERLAETAEEIFAATGSLESMHAASLSLGRPQAADTVALKVLELIQGGGR